MIYNDDCLNVLKSFSDNMVDMIYLDPPFFTQRKQSLSNSEGKKYEFVDVWDSRTDYLNYMKERLKEMHRVLKDTGSIFLHCDTSAAHYLRFLLDEIFGEKNFQSEIIWNYKRWSNSQRGLLPSHQTIFFYSKTDSFKFNTFYGEYSPTTNIDQILQERERNQQGKAVYKRDTNGEIVFAKEKKGVPISDVWEIPFLNPKAKERTGYPTQKPIELLERIISISTDPGDMVLDPFCGSGTTLVSATLLSRDCIGIDINPDAFELCNKRLENPSKTTSRLLKMGAESYKTKPDEVLAILKQFECDIVQRNKGIDAFLRKRYFGKPVAIRVQRNGESLLEAYSLLVNAGNKKNCSYNVLIYRFFDTTLSSIDVPNDTIIIPDYSNQLEEAIEAHNKEILIL